VLQSHCCTLHHRSLKNIENESKPSLHVTIAMKPSERVTSNLPCRYHHISVDPPHSTYGPCRKHTQSHHLAHAATLVAGVLTDSTPVAEADPPSHRPGQNPRYWQNSEQMPLATIFLTLPSLSLFAVLFGKFPATNARPTSLSPLPPLFSSMPSRAMNMAYRWISVLASIQGMISARKDLISSSVPCG
jgi:hypothetical protein